MLLAARGQNRSLSAIQSACKINYQRQMVVQMSDSDPQESRWIIWNFQHTFYLNSFETLKVYFPDSDTGRFPTDQIDGKPILSQSLALEDGEEIDTSSFKVTSLGNQGQPFNPYAKQLPSAEKQVGYEFGLEYYWSRTEPPSVIATWQAEVKVVKPHKQS
jgi:hypothetical protein